MPLVARVVNIILWGLALTMLIRLTLVWQSLPLQVATHFSGSGTPDRLMSRTALAVVIVAAAMIVPMMFTVRRFDRLRHAVLSGTAVALMMAFWMTIDFNLTGQPVSAATALAGGAIAGGLAYALFGIGRSEQPPQA